MGSGVQVLAALDAEHGGLKRAVDQVHRDGTRFLFTRYGKPVAAVVPIADLDARLGQLMQLEADLGEAYIAGVMAGLRSTGKECLHAQGDGHDA
jgi:hypothetical protein